MKRRRLCSKVWQIDSEVTGPNITILGGVHGNELPGISVVKDLLEDRALSGLVRRGTLNLGFGNPAAIMQGKRYVDRDLNRCFSDVAEGTRSDIEAIRAAELKQILLQTDVLFDVHATMKPSKPLILTANNPCDPLVRELASVLMIPTLVAGKGVYAEDGRPVATDAFMDANGKYGFTIEAGYMSDLGLVSRVRRALLQALSVLEMSEPVEDIQRVQIDAYQAYRNIAGSNNFIWATEWNNFSEVSAGQLIATRDGNPIVAERDSVILFPKDRDRIVPGEEAVILASKLE